MPRTRMLALVLTAAALLAGAACGGDDSPESTTTTTSTTIPAMPTDFRWWDPSPTPLGRGWVLHRCTEVELPSSSVSTLVGGGVPVLCFTNPDGRQGILRLFRFQAPADGDLNAHAGRFVQDFIDDRRQGCGAGYRVQADPIEALDVPGGPIRRYGFTGGATGSPTTERTVQWAGIRGPALEIVTISAYDPGSCVVPDGEATLQSLGEVIPGVDALIAASGLHGPPPGQE